jgi:hypothetical protein
VTVDTSTIVALAGMAVAGLVWLVRLEGRINVTEARFTDIIDRLARIEAKQDRKNSV